MKKIRIYNAGPLFLEYEVKHRLVQSRLMRELFERKGIKTNEYSIFNPIEAPFNGQLPSAETVFYSDYKEIDNANVFFFDIGNPLDSGTFMELGHVIERIMKKEKIFIYVMDSHIAISRSASGKYKGLNSPWGRNMYVTGSLDKNKIKVYSNFEEAIKAFEKDLPKILKTK